MGEMGVEIEDRRRAEKKKERDRSRGKRKEGEGRKGIIERGKVETGLGERE